MFMINPYRLIGQAFFFINLTEAKLNIIFLCANIWVYRLSSNMNRKRIYNFLEKNSMRKNLQDEICQTFFSCHTTI